MELGGRAWSGIKHMELEAAGLYVARIPASLGYSMSLLFDNFHQRKGQRKNGFLDFQKFENLVKCSLAHCGSNGVWRIMPEFYWVCENTDSAIRLD